MECNDRNELLEFQLQEALQHNFDEGNYVPSFKIPTVSVDYQVNTLEVCLQFGFHLPSSCNPIFNFN